MNNYNPKHAKAAEPFRETVRFKAIALVAAAPVAVGIAATGGAVATSYYHHAAAGPGWVTTTYGHTDPDHSDPSGEVTRIAPPETGTTVATFRNTTGPGGLALAWPSPGGIARSA